jgi:class 3 adenylate cyclase
MELESWLRSVGLEQYEAAFRENAIDEKVLLHLTSDDLKELGVAAVGHRRTLLDAIAALRASAELPETHADTASVKASDSGIARPSPIDSAERRQVTVVFADLVGSTALSTRMDPEDLRKVIAAYHKCAAGIVRRFGGFVSQYLGDGVLAYFGYPLAHEDDAERAVRASLELVVAVAALKTSTPLQTRVGIGTGLVVVGDVIDAGGSQERGIIGETPNLAARLQGLAEPNMVVIAESTRKLLGNLFELKDLGAKELKGIAERVRVWAVLRAASVTSRFDALHASDLSPFVGREHELEKLERGLDHARSQLRVIDLIAEPGMGKSRLVHEFRQRTGKDRTFILAGSCSPDAQQTPFLPFIEVLRGSFQINAGESEQDIAQKLGAGLTALGLHSSRNLGLLLHLLGLGVPDDALSGLDGVLIGLRTRELLQQLLEARCHLSPVMMVIEDLHWIDSVSEELLVKIVDSEAKLRLLLLTTRRPEYSPPWLGRAVVSKMILEPLPIGDIRRLIRMRLGVEALPEPLAGQVAERAEGNPLFAEEIISFLTERGLVRTTAGKLNFDAKRMPTALPGSVQSLLTARVDRLAQEDRTLLQAASVIGRRFDSQLLAAVVSATNVDARLIAMQALDIVYRESQAGDYAFKHALVRDALYQSLLSEPRRVLHLKIAKEIERRSGNRLIEVAEVLAHHYRQTDQADKAFAYLSMAGTKSLGVYSLDEAAVHFTSALALLDQRFYWSPPQQNSRRALRSADGRGSDRRAHQFHSQCVLEPVAAPPLRLESSRASPFAFHQRSASCLRP